MNTSPDSLTLKPSVTSRLLLIDGPSRAGKMLVGPLASNLIGIDYAQQAAAIDHIPILWRLGVLDDDNAAAFLRLTADVFVWDRVMGRHMNERPTDVWTIHRSLEYAELIERSVRTDGATSHDVLEAFQKSGRIQSYVVHEMLPHFRIWLQAFPDVRFLSTLRHPVDTCDSWRRRGWGTRWGIDPLAFIPVPKTPHGPVPWFVVDDAERYAAASPVDRIILGVLAISRRYDEALSSMSDAERAQVKIVTFENVATDPVGQMRSVADWLGTDPHPQMAVAYARERVPRRLDVSARREKFRLIEKDSTPELVEALAVASADYEEAWGLEALRP